MTLQQRIADKTAAVCVVGLGYVGLPLALTLAEIGYQVIGIDHSAAKVERIRKGESPLGDEPEAQSLLCRMAHLERFEATTDPYALEDADVIFVCVETPVNPDTHKPEYVALKAVLAEIRWHLHANALIIIESTLAPGTMQDLVKPALETLDGEPSDYIYLAHCPERIQPGRILETLRTRPRVVGGMTPQAAELAALLYRQITAGEVDTADCLTAELVKTAENAYRDVQIAFANSLALLCEDLGADVWRVRELVNKCPCRNVHEPGAGVGGHCIPKDPWLLIANAMDSNGECLIRAARRVNSYMPYHVISLLAEALEEAQVPLTHARVCVLGYSYLPGSADTRNSPSEVLVASLEDLVLEVRVHDPYVMRYRGRLATAISGMDAVVIMTAHEDYKGLGLPVLKQSLRHPILVDGRHVVNPEEARKLGFVFRGVGIG